MPGVGQIQSGGVPEAGTQHLGTSQYVKLLTWRPIPGLHPGYSLRGMIPQTKLSLELEKPCQLISKLASVIDQVTLNTVAVATPFPVIAIK